MAEQQQPSLMKNLDKISYAVGGVLALVVLLVAGTLVAADRGTTRILFIGNSYTAANQLDRMLAARLGGVVDVRAVQVLVLGVHLEIPVVK